MYPAYESFKKYLIEEGFSCKQLDAMGRFTKEIGSSIKHTDVLAPGPSFNFSEQKKAVLHEARIPLPEHPSFHLELDETLTMKVELRVLKTKTRGTINILRNGIEEGNAFEAEGDEALVARIDEVLALGKIKLDALVKAHQEEVSEARASIDEMYQQYKFNCLKLANYVDDYLHRSPSLEQAARVNIIREEFVRDDDPAKKIFSTYKPVYDPERNILILKEGHVEGYFHANSNIKIHESGAIIVILQITVRVRSTGDKYRSSAQAYYFFPSEGRFYNANAIAVKELGPVDKWDRSFFRGFESNVSKEFNYCFVCGSKLHYPSIPERIGDTWVHLLKPCCKCFAKGNADPKVFEHGINKVIARVHAKKHSNKRSAALRHLLGLDLED
ncbi:MAG: hypothetical protein ACFFCS_02270 [Candidatus Hodarchaeota archaeon]